MKSSTSLGILLSILAFSLILVMPFNVNMPRVNAAVAPRVEVWSPDVHSSNITDLTRFPVGSQFKVRVNVTNLGPITAFDVSLNYNITLGNNVISLVKTGAELTGGLFDPNYQFPGLPECTIQAATQFIVPKYPIRIRAYTQGGPECTVQGTGTLFTLAFNVADVGATSLDVVQYDGSGQLRSTIIGPSPGFPNVQYQLFDGYFRNAPGIPPVAQFYYNPPSPVVGDHIQFNATTSYDPDNSTMTGKGIKQYIWDFGDGTPVVRGSSVVTHIFLTSPVLAAAGTFQVKLVVIDVDDKLPQREISLVNVAPGVIHNISVSLSLDKPSVNVGDPVAVTVTISNRGNRDEVASLNVTYDYQGSTAVGHESGIILPVQGTVGASATKTFKYTLQTSSLPPRTYTVAGIGTITNTTTGGIVPDTNPTDNVATQSFSVLSTISGSFPLPVIAGGVAAVLIVAYAVVYVLRRRRKEEDADLAR